MDREAWHAAIHGVAKSRTRLSDCTELNWLNGYLAPQLKDTRGAQMKDRQLLSRDTEQSKLGIRWEASLTSLPPTNTVAKSMYVQKLHLQVLT